MFHLARWMVRHLDDPDLILWLTQNGGQLHHRLVFLIEDKLNTFVRLEREGKTDELQRIRSQSPNAIPRPLLRPLWRLFLTNRVKSPWHNRDLFLWEQRLNRESLTPTLRIELRDLLAPKVALKKPSSWLGDDSNSKSVEHLKQLVDWELVLASDGVRYSLSNLAHTSLRRDSLPTLLEDFQQLLRDALDLLSEMGEVDDHRDVSHWHLPSIKSHPQNPSYYDWVVLIELVRDAWLAILEKDISCATLVAQKWFAAPYPTYKRLALFAASYDDCIEPDQWVDWLVADGAWCLWSIITKRETLRLLVMQGIKLTSRAQGRLEAALLDGPPDCIFRGNIDPKWRLDEFDRMIWLRLAKLNSSGAKLGLVATERLDALAAAHPKWRIAENEQDEFPFWVSRSGAPDFEDESNVVPVPRTRRELVIFLKKPRPFDHPLYEDNWRDVCSTRFFHCAFALCDLAQEELWPVERWREALRAWSQEDMLLRSWRFIAPLVQNMPNEVLEDIAHSIAWWLEAVSKVVDRYEDTFLNLCQRILALPHSNGGNNDEPVSQAINHPIGYVTQALLNLWFKRNPNDNDNLPPDLEPIFTKLCDTRTEQFRHGRVLLSSRLITLFRVDRPWTEAHMLPLFDWTTDATEARAAWTGFLWSPRLFRPLLIAFKTQFLDTVHHYTELGIHAQRFAAFLTYAALDPVDTYTVQEFQTALGILPQEGIDESAQALVQALEGAGDKREEYWTNRIQPFWQNCWPQSRHLSSKSIAESLAQLSIAARGQFPAALAVLIDWLKPIENHQYVVKLLYESHLSERFPEDALRLLNAIIDDQPWASRELGQCLENIARIAPTLLQDARYQRLKIYFRRRGI